MPRAAAVRSMFEGVAPRYDLLNRVLSLGIDQGWRRQVVASLEIAPEHRVLDLCCGTGDLALEIARRGSCVACDFTWNMLVRAQEKAQGTPSIALAAADALALPFTDDAFDRASVAFGVRNLEDMGAGLREILRVLRPGGRLAILEFSQPDRFWLKLPYRLYLDWLLPFVGDLLGSRKDAYRYLAESIRGFPVPEVLVELMEDAGFEGVSYRRLSFGIVAVHLGTKPGPESPRASLGAE